jgi:RNA polymerase sigma factor (sigma-70 family)
VHYQILGVIKIKKHNNFKENSCQDKANHFIEENKQFLEHRVVKSFLDDEENKHLLLSVICYPTQENKNKLDEKFRKFYFNIRFTTFLSSTLYFNAVNYDKNHRKIRNRNQLTLDQPIGEGKEYSFKDFLEDPNTNINVENIMRSSDIKDYLVNATLLKAIDKLTIKQKEVIDLVYVKGLSDTDIGILLGKSQQVISKLHKKALKSIHEFIKMNEGDSHDTS